MTTELKMLRERVAQLETRDSELKDAVKRLEKNLLVMENFFSSTGEAVIQMDTDGVVLAINEVAASRYGRNADELTGLNIDEFMPADAVEKYREMCKNAISSRKPAVFEDMSNNRHFTNSIHPVFSKDGELFRLMLISHDITERERAKKHEILLAHTHDFTYHHNIEGAFEYISPSVEQITGYTVEEWMTHNVTCMTDNPINKRVLESTEKEINEGSDSLFYQVEIFHKQGHRIWLEVNEKPYLTQGRVSGIIGMARDITKSKEAEDQTHKSEELFHAFMRHCPFVAYIKDTQSRILYLNPFCEEKLNMNISEMIGKSHNDLYPPEVAARLTEIDRKVLSEGKLVEEEEVVPLDNVPNEFLAYKFPIFDSEGKPYLIGGISINITEKKRAERELESSRETLAKAQQIAHLGSCSWNTLTGEVTWTDEMFRILGLEPGEITPSYDAMLNAVHPEERERVGIALNQTLENGKSLNSEHRIIRPDGSVRFVHELGEVLLDANNTPVGIICTILDVTDRKYIDEVLRKSRELVRIQGMAHIGSWSCNLLTGKVTFSDETYSIFGLDPKKTSPENKLLLNAIHPDDRELAEKALAEALSGESINPVDIEYRIIQPNGTVRFVRSQADIILDKDKKAVNVIIAVLDITESKQAQDKLRQAKDTAEDATRLKDKFVSLVAHDLRSPFSSMLGLMRLIIKDTDDPLSDNHKKLLSRVEDSGIRLVRMIDELLNISRLKTGQITLKPRFFDAYFVAQNVKGLLSHLAKEKKITLVSEIPVGTRLYGDFEMFCQVLQNLLSNAIKFSNRGSSITIFVPPDQPNTVAVRDNGIGISSDRLAKLFIYEEMTSTIGTDGERGTGFGLPFSMDIMKANGGELTVESSEKGSIFYARLPYVRPRILIVDDEISIRILLKEYLRPVNVDIMEAENGEQALDIIKKSTPHLLLVDIMMPIMDGFTFLEMLKKDSDKPHLPVIVLTTDNQMETRDRAFQLGADDFVRKPIMTEDFIPRVKRFII